MVVVGAGASIELGMPSVRKIDNMFHEWARKEFPLVKKTDQSLYSYLRDTTNKCYLKNPRKGTKKEANYEDVLFSIFHLSSLLTDRDNNFPLNAFLRQKKLPEIKSLGLKMDTTGDVLMCLSSFLVDELFDEFRRKCLEVSTKPVDEFGSYVNFLSRLRDDYELVFISLNYDNLVTQVFPNLFTGFDNITGCFRPESVHEHQDWDSIYHVHGSVHFEMGIGMGSMHTIFWNNDLSSVRQNSRGRGYQRTMEGIKLPTSAIVAGYGKEYQIQRLPFRTYYGQIDKLVETADAFLFLGYGFGDFHLNNCFHAIRKRARPVIIVDCAERDQDSLRIRSDSWARNLLATVETDNYKIATRRFRHKTPCVAELIDNDEFEISTNPLYPLSVWYGGFMRACKNYDLVKFELDN